MSDEDNGDQTPSGGTGGQSGGTGSGTSGDEGKGGQSTAALVAALAEERRVSREARTRVAELERVGMSEADAAIAEAKEAGKAEERRTAGSKLVAAEFKAAIVGKFSDAKAVLDVVDLSRFVDDDGDVDDKKIRTAVDALLASVVKAPAGRIPGGARGDESEGGDSSDDWMRDKLRPAG